MKLLVGLSVLFFVGLSSAQDVCSALVTGDTTRFTNLEDACNTEVMRQVKREARASFRYFQMGAHFANDQVNLPGFSELFFKAAKEERDHSATLMDYLATRLSKDKDTNYVYQNLLTGTKDEKEEPLPAELTGVKALKEALGMEQTITNKIKAIIKACDATTNEYHVSDFLTGDFLTEQYESERNFAGKLATLEKMWDSHGSLAEFMFDKTL